MTETIFTKIINREIKADIVYEDDLCIAFNDINPQAPTHILIIPKKTITKLSDANDNDQALLGHLLIKAKDIAKKLEIEKAYRLIINNGEAAGQTVFHLHIHLLAGRAFNWPPG